MRGWWAVLRANGFWKCSQVGKGKGGGGGEGGEGGEGAEGAEGAEGGEGGGEVGGEVGGGEEGGEEGREEKGEQQQKKKESNASVGFVYTSVLNGKHKYEGPVYKLTFESRNTLPSRHVSTWGIRKMFKVFP
ncbi:hypothetical protein M8J77_006656 [Diaphorina citri]|nr:hypothetical protein M8J77_006656 [Diaphorina citri]